MMHLMIQATYLHKAEADVARQNKRKVFFFFFLKCVSSERLVFTACPAQFCSWFNVLCVPMSQFPHSLPHFLHLLW